MSIGASNISMISGKSNSAQIHQGNRDIRKPSIPSNLEELGDNKPQFNSIGYYGDLLSRLDGQIGITEDVYKKTFFVS